MKMYDFVEGLEVKLIGRKKSLGILLEQHSSEKSYFLVQRYDFRKEFYFCKDLEPFNEKPDDLDNWI